ncbi:MAG: hypothetical protein JO354_06870 [Verrucomicrobia bacterium]|nr:hypothetical protein [Verrucomicrobiota bacterium]
MVAFKEEFPYLRAESGQLFEFDRRWLREAITRAAQEAGYSSWWLTDHVTESIAFYLRLRNDESFVAFSQLSQTVRYVLKVIGYNEIGPHFAPAPPPVTVSLFEIAEAAGAGYELAFFEMLGRRIEQLLSTGVNALQFVALGAAVKHLRAARAWSRSCDSLRGEIVCFIREKLAGGCGVNELSCSLR